MKRIEIEVAMPAAALDGFAETWRAIEAGQSVTPRFVFGSLAELFSAITPKRLELIRYVAVHEGLNIRQLSQALKRDYKNVHTDITELLDLGLLEKSNHGGISAPFDEIVIRAEIRAAA